MDIFRKKRNLRPKPRTVHGIEIKKQPTLAYIQATERMSGIFMELVDATFPGKTPKQVVEYISTIDGAKLKEVFARLMSVFPAKLLDILREIVGAQNNPTWNELTPTEHMEVVKAFWEMNDLSTFFTSARHILMMNWRAGSEAKDGLKD